MPDKATKFSKLTTRGLLSDEEKRLVTEALKSLRKHESEEAMFILNNIQENRKLNEQIKDIENQLDKINKSLAKHIAKLIPNIIQVSEDTVQLCTKIAKLVRSTEHEHRLEQVRRILRKKFLNPCPKLS